MRIPAEAIPPAPSVAKEAESPRKPEPVTKVSTLANDLSASPQTPSRPFHERPPYAQETVAPTVPVSDDARAVPLERRKGERRSENRPVLLDTRSKRCRRESSRTSRISIKV